MFYDFRSVFSVIVMCFDFNAFPGNQCFMIVLSSGIMGPIDDWIVV